MTNRFDWKTSASISAPYFSQDIMADFEKNGINFMELTAATTYECDELAKKPKTYFKTASDFGVTIRSVHLPFWPFDEIDPASTNADAQKIFLKTQGELVKIVADNGAKIAVIHPSGEPYPEETRHENLKAAIDSLGKLNEIAKSSGIILAVENLPRTCILRDCKEIEALKNAIPDIHFTFDSNHSLKDKNTDIIKAMGDRIVALHISDYDFIDERHLFCGEGKNNWQEIMKTLEEVGYNGTWNYEIKDSYKIPAKQFKENHENLLKCLIK